MPGGGPPSESPGRRRLAQVAVAAVSAATAPRLVLLAVEARLGAWPSAVELWLTVAFPALPFPVLAWAARRPDPTHPPGEASVGVVVCLVDNSPDEARATLRGIAALGPTVALTTDPATAERAGADGVPAVVGATMIAGLATAAESISAAGVFVLTDSAYPDLHAARRAASLFDDPHVGWVTGRALPLNRDGYGPTGRQRLDSRLRVHCRAAGAALWEGDATIVRTRLVRELPPRPDEGWSAWLRRAGAAGWRGATTTEALAGQRLPVTADSYWRQAVIRQRLHAAGLADACRHGPRRARLRAAALLMRSLYGWWLVLVLAAPAALALQGEFPFSVRKLHFVVGMSALGTMRWAVLRWVHGLPLRPARDVLAMAYDAPGSVLSTHAVVTGRVHPTRVALPPRPLGWIAAALAVPLIASVAHRSGNAGYASAVAGALVVLLLLWSFAMQGIVQLLKARNAFRIPLELAVTLDGRPGRTRDASPRGIAVSVTGAAPAAGEDVAVAIALDDGRTLATRASVRHREQGADAAVVGLELALDDEQSAMWAAQLARVAVVLTNHRPAAQQLAAVDIPIRQRAAHWLVTGIAVVVLAGVSGMLALPAFGYRSAVVASASMVPALQTGDLVILRDTVASELALGDIVRIDLSGDGGTTHRVVALDERDGNVVVTTRGDANPAPEQWELTPDTAVGAVELRIPRLGRAISRVGTLVPRHVVALAVLALAGIAVARARAGAGR